MTFKKISDLKGFRKCKRKIIIIKRIKEKQTEFKQESLICWSWQKYSVQNVRIHDVQQENISRGQRIK